MPKWNVTMTIEFFTISNSGRSGKFKSELQLSAFISNIDIKRPIAFNNDNLWNTNCDNSTILNNMSVGFAYREKPKWHWKRLQANKTIILVEICVSLMYKYRFPRYIWLWYSRKEPSNTTNRNAVAVFMLLK